MRRALAAVGLLVAVTMPGTAAAAPEDATVVPIQVTGDPAERFNLVMMGDGYTAAELPKFREHVDKHLNVLWTIEPFKSYRSYVNVYAVEIPSPESGVDCDPNLDSPRRDTPLNMGFWGGCNANSVQRLLGVDGAAANRLADLVPGTTTANRQLLALGNSDTYGGAGGANATASGGNALSSLITPHELGHSLGGLQDEYDYLTRGVRGQPYTGGEPTSSHHTLLTEEQMAAERRKWWRWLGEESEAGGPIARYEGGLYNGSGVWRPAAHSMMKTLGYYFDEISREQLVHRISAKTAILRDATPGPVLGADRVVWVETAYPVSHQLDVTWTLDGSVVATGDRSVDLSTLDLTGTHRLEVVVTDPTEFVRDPAIRGSAALTQRRMWMVDATVTTPVDPVPAEFTGSTPTTRPVGAEDVVYVETTHPVDAVPPVTWTLDGTPLPGADRAVDLSTLDLSGTHTLTAAVGSRTLRWQVDATGPSVAHSVAGALLTVPKPGGTEYIVNGPFTMALDGADDTPGHVVHEFRTDGDGWFNYFGWPTDPDAPFLFTPQGTTIDSLVYGKLGVPRLSPWDEVPTSYGRHTVEYRSIDPSGNIGAAEEFAVTLLPAPPACTTTITGRHHGPLAIRSGVTCLTGATVSGQVTVHRGATLVATDATITGPVSASRASVSLLNSRITGSVALTGGAATLVGGTITGPVTLRANRSPILAGVTIHGPLSCQANSPAPADLGAPNTVTGPTTGTCP
jgi:hypothetical protein